MATLLWLMWTMLSCVTASTIAIFIMNFGGTFIRYIGKFILRVGCRAILKCVGYILHACEYFLWFSKIFTWLLSSRYEFQKDNSLLGEDHFAFDSDWLKNQIHGCLEFWLGEREACYTPEEERWKCRFCQFASICPTNNGLDSTPSPTNTSPDSTPHKHELE